MAVEERPELVGKRFLCVSGLELVEPAETARWRWRAGVIRAVTHRDSDNPELMVYVEFDGLEWEKREWVKVYEGYRVFLLEKCLVWAWRKDTTQLRGSKVEHIKWPALTFKPLVGKSVLGTVTTVEFLCDRQLDFLTKEGAYWPYEEEAASLNPVLRDNLQLHQEVCAWVKEQKIQHIFMRGPYSLSGHRVRVYRQDSATQWFSGIITHHNLHSRMMIVMNDQVLEPQNVDPSTVQMTFLDDIVRSLLKGEDIGIMSRRRTRTSQNRNAASPHFTWTQGSSPRPLTTSASMHQVQSSQNSPGQQRGSSPARIRDPRPKNDPSEHKQMGGEGENPEGKDLSVSKSEDVNKRRKPEKERSDVKRRKAGDGCGDRAAGPGETGAGTVQSVDRPLSRTKTLPPPPRLIGFSDSETQGRGSLKPPPVEQSGTVTPRTQMLADTMKDSSRPQEGSGAEFAPQASQEAVQRVLETGPGSGCRGTLRDSELQDSHSKEVGLPSSPQQRFTAAPCVQNPAVHQEVGTHHEQSGSPPDIPKPKSSPEPCVSKREPSPGVKRRGFGPQTSTTDDTVGLRQQEGSGASPDELRIFKPIATRGSASEPSKSAIIVDKNQPLAFCRDFPLIQPQAETGQITYLHPHYHPLHLSPRSTCLASPSPHDPSHGLIHHPHLLPSMLSELAPPSLLGAMALSPHPHQEHPLSPANTSYNDLGLYPIVWQYPTLGLPSSKWGLPESSVSSETCLRRNALSPWLPQHTPVTSPESLGFLSHAPARPASADPHPCSNPSAFNHTPKEKKAFVEQMQAFTPLYTMPDQDGAGLLGAREGHLQHHFLERALLGAGDRAHKYKEESRRILQESIQVAPYTAKIRPSEGEREPYLALSISAPPLAKSHTLHRDLGPSPSEMYGLKPVLPSLSSGEAGQPCPSSPLPAPLASSRSHSVPAQERPAALSTPDPLPLMPALHRAPIFQPVTQPVPGRLEGRTVSPPTLTPVQLVHSAGMKQTIGLVLDQQKPPALFLEGCPPRVKPQSPAASVIVRPSYCSEHSGRSDSNCPGKTLPGGDSEHAFLHLRNHVRDAQGLATCPLEAPPSSMRPLSSAVSSPSASGQGQSGEILPNGKAEGSAPTAGGHSVGTRLDQEALGPSPSTQATQGLQYPSHLVHVKRHKAVLAAAQCHNTTPAQSDTKASHPLMPPISYADSMNKADSLTNGQPDPLNSLTNVQPAPHSSISNGQPSPPSSLSSGQPAPASSLSNGQPAPASLPSYHKLKKAWLTRHSEEDRNSHIAGNTEMKPSTISLTTKDCTYTRDGPTEREDREEQGQESPHRAAKRSYKSTLESAEDSDGSQSECRAKRQAKPTFKKKQSDLRKRRSSNRNEEEPRVNGIFRSTKDIRFQLASSNGIPRSVLKDWRKVRKLKQTGESFLQDDACSQIAPKLQKCRECRLARSRKGEEPGHSPVFCRFYYFRRLSYSKNGVVRVDGFSFPDQYDDEATSLWTPSTCKRNELGLETSKCILSSIGDKFCQLVTSEITAAACIKKNVCLAWKRPVRGVREMCDACEATLFNLHWVCQKCGFVVCLDCYKAKERKGPKEKDLCPWLKCVKGQPHDPRHLMPTQIIPGTVLVDLLNTMHTLREKFGIRSHCACSGKFSKIPSTYGMPQVLQNVINHCNKMSLCKTHGGQEEPSLKVESDCKLVLPESQSTLHFLADLTEQKSCEEKKENKESPVGAVVKEAEQGEGVEAVSAKSSISGTSGMEQGSTLRDLLTTTAGKLCLGSPDASMAFSPVYSSPCQTGKSSRSMPNILDDIIASVVENRIPAGKPSRPKHKPEAGEEVRVEPRKPDAKEPVTAPLTDAPHAWLYNKCLLWLTDHHHPGNHKLFRESWEQGQPVVVSGIHRKLRTSLWTAEAFNQEFADHQRDLLNGKSGTVSVKEFWDGFEDLTQRRSKGSEVVASGLKDCLSGEEFMALLPSRYSDLMTNLPLPEYTAPEGSLNLASRLPPFFVRPDLGPRLRCAYGASQEQNIGTDNLHLEVSDTISILVYVGMAKGNGVLCKTSLLKRLEKEDLDDVMKRRLKESSETPGALWHIYNSRDVDKIKEFLRKVAREQGDEVLVEQDPIREPGWYLSKKLRDQLLEEQGVQGQTVLQFQGDAVLIPAGAPYQVQNLHSCVQVINDFVSPEHVGHSFHLTQELRSSCQEVNYEDKLQIKNIFYHSIKDAVGTLKRCCAEEPGEAEEKA